MLKRLLRVLIYILCFPIIGITAYSSIIISLPIGIILYIIGKVNSDGILDMVVKPFMWAIMIPDLILGEN